MISRTVNAILAIAPNSRGFGYALFTTPQKLLDWGIKEVRIDKNTRCATLASALIAQVQPSALIIEDCVKAGCRRSVRVRELLGDLTELAEASGVSVYAYSRRQVMATFNSAGRSKDAIALAVTDSVPALLPWLPRRRRIWESEQHSMAIFEAAALALTHYAVPDITAEPQGDPTSSL